MSAYLSMGPYEAATPKVHYLCPQKSTSCLRNLRDSGYQHDLKMVWLASRCAGVWGVLLVVGRAGPGDVLEMP